MQTLSTGNGFLTNPNATSAARDMANLLMPELGDYEWTDTFFDHVDRDIIAVFDHKTSQMAAHRMAWVMFFVFLALVVCALRSLDEEITTNGYGFNSIRPAERPSKFKFVKSKRFKVNAFIFGTLFSLAWVWHIAPPHTAVTSTGVLHVTSGSLLGGAGQQLFFPFHGIFDLKLEESVYYAKTLITHANQHLFYEEIPPRRPFLLQQNRGAVSVIPYLNNHELFQRAVLALKNSDGASSIATAQRDETNFTSFVIEMMANSVVANESEWAMQVLGDIRDELKRRNDLLESLLQFGKDD
ncbi:hypothetical protein MPSEU_000687100 [Mayamaea pseudoterrestris]|nr:hypothetical protein MPSEU_000687100 [Mayamaea pseudoterrestris]